jgi:hypothetical protein
MKKKEVFETLTPGVSEQFRVEQHDPTKIKRFN